MRFEDFVVKHRKLDFMDEVLNKLCFHDKSKKEFKKLSEVSSTGDICFGKLDKGVFIEF